MPKELKDDVGERLNKTAMELYGIENFTDLVADEISASLEALVGTTDDRSPVAEPKHPTTDSTTGKFKDLQFGRNYDPNNNNKR